MWYVIQVLKGREEAMAELIGRVVPEKVRGEVFVPRYATEIKVRGSWIPVERPLFPGYLIAITDAPQNLERHLRALGEFARVLSQGECFVPLADEEMQVIASFTRPGERVVPMSMGVKDGDRVLITSGPLVGHEGLIREVNRRKSTAVLEFDLCGRRVSTRVGLGIVSKEQWLKKTARACAEGCDRWRRMGKAASNAAEKTER